jgi:hypothetical protein
MYKIPYWWRAVISTSMDLILVRDSLSKSNNGETNPHLDPTNNPANQSLWR